MLKFLLACLPLALLSLPAAAVDTSRPEVHAFIEEVSQDYGFDRRQLRRLISQAETRQPILDAIARPAERVIPWYEYRERFMTEKRIREGIEFWSANDSRLARIKDEGIATTVVGILGVETSFGRITGRYRVLDSLATLAFDYPPRSAFFRGELKQFLLLAREERGIDPTTALGSYAGAMGSAQFIATSYRQFAVDGDGDGHRDLWTNWDDVIGSVANYLLGFGWRPGEPVIVGATLAEGVDASRLAAPPLELNETVQSLRDKGLKFETTLGADAPAMLVTQQGRDGPEYRVGFNNFFVITRYNRSPMYAMAVHDLGHAIRDSK